MDYVPRSVHWLIPEETAPCDVFLYFRGKYAQGLAAKAPIPLELIEKTHKARSFFVYIKSDDAAAWDTWVAERHQRESSAKKEVKKSARADKRAEYLSYIQKAMAMRDENDMKLTAAHKAGMQALQGVMQSPMLDWYFTQFHEPPDLFHHSARLAGSLAIFASLYPLLTAKELENLLFSVVIHELQGDPKTSLNTVVSSTTIENLERHKHLVSEEVLELIEKHDELFSGKGFPNNLKGAELPVAAKIFSLFNHYEHYRLKQSGTRRARHEATKKLMEARKADYEPRLWIVFWEFVENQLEFVV